MNTMKDTHDTGLLSLDQDQSTTHIKARKEAEACPYT